MPFKTQSLAGAACARRRRRNPSALPARLEEHESAYSEAKTTDVPAGRDGMYVKDFSAQSDWMHHGEGLQLFNRMALSVPDLPASAIARDASPRFTRARMRTRRLRFEKNNKSVASMAAEARCCGRRRPSTGSAIRSTRPASSPCTERPLRAVPSSITGNTRTSPATTSSTSSRRRCQPTPSCSPARRSIAAGSSSTWTRGWREIKQNAGIIPSFVDVDGTIGGHGRRWWTNAYGLGIQSDQPGDRPPRAPQPHPSRARRFRATRFSSPATEECRCLARHVVAAVSCTRGLSRGAPSIRRCTAPRGGTAGSPSRGALGASRWYWSMRAANRERIVANPWLNFFEGKNAAYPRGAHRCRPRSTASRADWRPSARIGRFPTSASPTTCSTPTRRRPTPWCD